MQCKLIFKNLEVKSRIMEIVMCLCVSCIVSKNNFYIFLFLSYFFETMQDTHTNTCFCVSCEESFPTTDTTQRIISRLAGLLHE